MKKSLLRKISICLTLVLGMAVFSGCNRKITIDYGYDAKDYITELAEYKGVEYTPDNRVVEESEIDAYIQKVLENATTWTETTDQKVSLGDKVTIQVKATDADGMYLPELSTSDDYDVVLGSGSISNNYENFEESLVGMLPGRTKQIKCIISDTFEGEKYRGQEITFTVAVVTAYSGTVPSLTDGFVNTLTSGKYTTAEEYRKGIRALYEADLEEEKHSNRYEEVIETIMNNTKVSSYPEDILKEQIERTTSSMDMYAAIYNMETEEYCQDRFGCTIEEYAKRVVLQEMILQQVVEKEGLTLTTKEYKNNLDEFAQSVGYSDGEALLEKYDKEYVQKNMLLQKAMDLIYDSSVPKQ